jgi:hypothetical protein
MREFDNEPEYGIHEESGKTCRSCGRTNCEDGCEIATEMKNG